MTTVYCCSTGALILTILHSIEDLMVHPEKAYDGDAWQEAVRGMADNWKKMVVLHRQSKCPVALDELRKVIQ